jgi:hypothetical protein
MLLTRTAVGPVGSVSLPTMFLVFAFIENGRQITKNCTVPDLRKCDKLSLTCYATGRLREMLTEVSLPRQFRNV